ncbi:MAG TPA: L-threonylcarbamoyladenylate synthase, partial [Armatimonadota bacterium]|nr:L-threonylcarbamoyladenylate synthase [Armatimonadota bacterium]
SPRVPDLVSAGMDSVAVRMPANETALALLRSVGAPLAAPSANLFSRPSPTTARHVLEDLDGRIDAVLDGGPAGLGVESTVVDVRASTPVILRPGGVPRETLEQVLGVRIRLRNEAATSSTETDAARSPGLLTRHYSPRAEVRLYEGDDEAVVAAIRRLALAADAPPATAILSYTEDLPRFRDLPVTLVDLGSCFRLEEVARRLYAALRRLDTEGVVRIVVRLAPHGGLGDAINDRLRRAASGRVERLLG